MGQPVAMFEITSPDGARALEFYTNLFGWSARDAGGGYQLVDTGAGDGAIPGGIGQSDDPAEAGVKVYVRVDDLSAYLDRAVSLGGARVVEPSPLPDGYGSIAVLTDPDGNQVGLWS